MGTGPGIREDTEANNCDSRSGNRLDANLIIDNTG